MKKSIRLNDTYIMLITVQYIKNVSKGTAEYQVSSKIVKEKDYLLDEKTIGEIQGEYFKRIHVKFYKNFTINQLNQKRIKKEVNKSITKMHKLSIKLVNEWKDYDTVLKEAECTIEQLVNQPI